jgi:3-hydroxyacyl-CoA dehydrogenase/enoyl-CoA hydratase/3-hydroxybutyryl-CoA epimerase
MGAFTWNDPPAGLSTLRLGVLVFDLAGRDVNVLDESVLSVLEQRVSEIGARRLEAVVLVSGKKTGFCAGADVELIASVTSAKEGAAKAALGQRAFEALAGCGVPTVAAIHGACVGGGAELACWCSARVLTWDDRTRIGFPEVNLGIIPGFGGTQMLPRLVGLLQAIQLASSGRVLAPKEARRIGLADAVVEKEHLLAEAARQAERLRGTPARRSTRWSCWPLVRDVVAAAATRQARKVTGGHYPAPLAAVRLCRIAASTPLQEGLREEASELGRLVISPESKALQHVYELKRTAERAATKPSRGALVGVLGAGVMGAGIAGVAATKGFTARLRDLDAGALARGMETIRGIAAQATRKARDPRTALQQALDRVSTSLALDGLSRADLVVEAVIERLDVKLAVLAEVEAACGAATLVATNTSSLSVAQMASALRDPSRFVGLHFFNPVAKMPLVEIIRGSETTDTHLERARGWALALGKTPVLVADTPGFLVNRLLMPYLAAALRLQAEGVGIARIDAAARQFGMAMGPFRVLDEVGLDVAAHVQRTFVRAWPERFSEAPVLKQLVEAGRLGKKSGGGFYEKRGRSWRPTSRVGAETAAMPAPAIKTLLFAPMAEEAQRCLDEKVVASPRDVDLATVFAIGFPAFRGGLARWMSKPVREV